jgi:hypothetical protein
VAELLELQDQAVGRARFEQLDWLQRYVNALSQRVRSKKLVYSIVRGLYARNRVELPRDMGFVIRSDVPPQMGEPFDVEGLKRLIGIMPRLYRAIFLCMFQGGMGSEEFMMFNKSWSHIKPQLDEGRALVKVYLPGRKHSRNRMPYYTFLGRDSINALKAYLDGERGAIRNGEPIFFNTRRQVLTKNALKQAITRYAERVGLITPPTPSCRSCGGSTIRTRRRRLIDGNSLIRVSYLCKACGADEFSSPDFCIPINTRYGVSGHELRDLFRTEWQRSSADPVCAEFFLGHDIDPNHYNKIMKLHPEWAEEQYVEAMPFLNIVSEDPRKVGLERVRELEEKTAEIEDLKREMADQQQNIKNLRAALSNIERMLRKNMSGKP